MVLAKEKNDFIDLKEKLPELVRTAPGISEEKLEPRGPTFYVNDIDLPIDDEDIDSVITAVVKLKPRSVRISIENGKKRKSYDLEVTAISFNH